jgi:rhamnosyltransferase
MGCFEKWFCEKCGVDVESVRVLLVIPILNPPEWFLSDIIGKLHHQSISPKILLINSGKKIENGEYEVINIQKEEFNHANTRNIALEYEADFYLFMTQDATPFDGYLIENLLRVFEDNEVVVSYAKQVPYADANEIEVFARTTNYPEVSKVKSKADLPMLGIKTFFSSDTCAMYKSDYFKQVGGFKKNLNTNEDMEFVARAIINGKKVAYCAEAKVYHSHNFSIIEVYKRYKEIGKFFKNNSWILEEVAKYSSAESTGLKQVKEELKYLLKKNPLLIPKSIIFSLTKYLAFKM